MIKKPKLSFWQIWNMNIGFLGIQFSFGLQQTGDTENVLLFYGYDDFDGVSKTDYTRDKDLSCHTSSCIGLFILLLKLL